MKRIIAILAACILAAPAFAQTSETEYQERYVLLVNRLGPAGVGIETLLDRWEADYPEDPDLFVARFNYYNAKAQRSEVVAKDAAKFLGNQPVLTLKDSLGADIRYFEEIFYDDELYGKASEAIDRAIRIAPEKLEYRFCKITSLISYEKESPDMATAALLSLIDYYYGTKGVAWTYNGEAVDAEFFKSAVQEYCYTFYTIGSPTSYSAFKTVSEKMVSYNKNDTVFLGNLGSYYYVVKGDNRNAKKYYDRVLKVSPEDYPSIKNCVLMARKAGDAKMEKKYLPLLVRYSPDTAEQMSAQARLDFLNKKK